MDGNIKRKKKKSSCWTKRDEGMGLKLPTKNLLHRKREERRERERNERISMGTKT